MNIEKWKENNLKDLTGKVVVVTGATGVIAGYVIEGLLQKGASIVFCYRSLNNALNKKQEYEEKFKGANIVLQQLDLADLESIKTFVSRIYESYPQGIDYFINLAGCFNVPKKQTSLGYDIVFQTNAIAPIYLMERLLPLIDKKQGRVVNVTSLSYDFVHGFDEKDCERINRSAVTRYAVSKRFLTMYSLNKSSLLINSDSKSSVVLCHPGICATNIIHYKNGGFSKGLYKFAKGFMNVVFPPPQKTALCILKAVCMDAPTNLVMVAPYSEIYGYPKVKTVKLNKTKRKDMEFVITKSEQILKSI